MNVNEIPWDKEPTATHFTFDDENWYESFWKKVDGVWCCKYTDPEHWQDQSWEMTRFRMEDFDVLIERPKLKEQEDYMPEVGEICEFLIYDVGEKEYGYNQCKVLAYDEDNSVVFRITSGEHLGKLESKYAGWYDENLPMFRPLVKEPSVQEKLLEAWKRRSLDFCEDDMRTMYALEAVFNFIEKNYELKEK